MTLEEVLKILMSKPKNDSDKSYTESLQLAIECINKAMAKEPRNMTIGPKNNINIMACPNCGHQVTRITEWCHFCGQHIRSQL